MGQELPRVTRFIRPTLYAGLAATSIETTVAQEESSAVEATNVAILGSYINTDGADATP